jgi:hypothetical protein
MFDKVAPLIVIHRWLALVTSPSFTVSKRLLGAALALAGIAGFIGILLIDVLDVGREGGIGPAQQLALAGCIGMLLVGLSLLPLGNRPA